VEATEIKITIDETGTVSSDWWTPEQAEVICLACQECEGWKTANRKLDCTAGNQWCG
jgi:hypothetical protein